MEKDNWQEFRYTMIGLFLVFTAMKLMGHVGWSWWAVTAPLWLPAAIAIPILVLVMLAMRRYK